MEFIDFRLRWDGKINRSELVEFFGISIQQASADIARYESLAPGNLSYDRNGKTYRATSEFKPMVSLTDTSFYLRQLVDANFGTAPQAANFIGWQPPCDIVHYPSRLISESIFRDLVWAVRDLREIEITYQSMRRAGPSTNWIGPHAFGYDGLRWHVRAWCYENREFRDFVLSRITNASNLRPRNVDPQLDVLWRSYVEVVVQANKGLSEAQKSAIEADYGMREGKLVVRCRKAMAYYVIRQLRLERSDISDPIEQPLELANREELLDVFAHARKQRYDNFDKQNVGVTND